MIGESLGCWMVGHDENGCEIKGTFAIFIYLNLFAFLVTLKLVAKTQSHNARACHLGGNFKWPVEKFNCYYEFNGRKANLMFWN